MIYQETFSNSKIVAHFLAYSIATDESVDVIDTTQLAIFICGVDRDVAISEKSVEIETMKRTVKADIHETSPCA